MNYVRSRDAQKQLARTSLRSIKWLKCIKKAIKVHIPHEKLCFCCFLTVSCHINAILTSCNVLVFQLLTEEDEGKLDCITLPGKKIATKITVIPLQSPPNFA